MTVGFWDVVHLVEILKENKASLDDATFITTKLMDLHWKRKNLSSVVNILANALYELFSAGSGKGHFLFYLHFTLVCLHLSSRSIRDGVTKGLLCLLSTWR